MKNYILFIIILVAVSSCREDINEYDKTVIEAPVIELIEASFKGIIVNEQGEPVPDANVFVENHSTMTDFKGRFAFSKIEVKKGDILIRSEKDGFFISSSTMRNSSNATSYPRLTMLDKGEPEVYDLNSKEPLVLESGVKLSFPENSILTSSGLPFEGKINVFSKTSSPNDKDFVIALPGNLKGMVDGKKLKALAPISMFKIELETENGQKLKIDDKGIGIEIPIPNELLNSAPEEVSLWVFDLDLGRWLNRDLCIKNGGVYTGTCTGVGTWIPCEQYDLINFETDIFHIDTTPASYLILDLEARDVTFRERWYSDSEGHFETTIPKGYILDYTITDVCNNVLYESPIGEFNLDVVLDPIILDTIIDTFSFVIKGRLVDCDQNPIDTGLVEVYFQNHFKDIWTDADGYFEKEITFSCTDFPEIILSGYNQNESLRKAYVIDSEEDIDFGDIVACEQKEDFLSYIYKGETYEIIPCKFKFSGSSGLDFTTRPKLIQAHSQDGAIGLFIKNDVQYHNTAQKPAIFWSDNVENSNMFPFLYTQGFDMTVTITKENGTFIEGTFEGNVIELDFSGTYPIVGSFKARK